LIRGEALPLPEEIEVEPAVYLNGLAEVTGELRRRTLDTLRQGYSPEVERLLNLMDEIYALLITIDYPDALTNGLRRQTDLARGIVERTRGDVTISLREQRLTQSMKELAILLKTQGMDGEDVIPQPGDED
jgi:translin